MNRNVSIAFTGDIGFDKYMNEKWKESGLIDDEIRSFLCSSDHTVINVEGPVTEIKTRVTDKGVTSLIHSIPPEATPFLKSLDADVWNICNNHICDAGADGIEDTLKYASLINVDTLGAGMNLEEASSPVFFEGAGGIGLIGVGYQRACRKAGEDTPGCFSWSDLELIEKRIKEIKSKCRWCIIVAHAGEEFTSLPSPYTRDRYHKYLEMGADIIVCHHPHVPMNYETIDGKAIFYSLGNFIFDTDYQRSQPNTDRGIVLRLNLNPDNFSFEAVGLKIDRGQGKIVSAELPEIFTDVPGEEYELLAPLAAKAFIENTKIQQRFLFPDKYSNATDEDWHNNFYEPLRSGRVPGETLDFQIIVPLAENEKEKAWTKSKLENVKKYILEQI